MAGASPQRHEAGLDRQICSGQNSSMAPRRRDGTHRNTTYHDAQAASAIQTLRVGS